jgi:GxxExxY protein
MDHDTAKKLERVLFRDESYAIQGAVFEVYREMGSGFLEPVYQECLALEFCRRKIPFTAQNDLSLVYKGERLQQIYRPDFLCFEKVIVEIKAAKALAPEHRAQLLNYLKATEFKLGLLVNFGHYPKVQMERLVL